MHLLDFLFGAAARGPRFFADGWGDAGVLDSTDPLSLASRSPGRIRVRWSPERRHGTARLREGVFESPEERLPERTRRGRLQLLLPQGRVRGVALHLSASGDEGFRARLRFASPLLARGIGALVLENAFYGARRPCGQLGPAVRSVSNLYLMGAATLQEGRALLCWLRQEISPLVGVTGFSMGGQMAAMVGATSSFPVAVVPLAPTCSPDSVLRDGVLRDLADWGALVSAGQTREEARRALCERLSRFSVRALPRPLLPEAAIVVGTASDGVVPPEDMRKVAEHWGCELRWIAAGHVWAVLRHQAAMRAAVSDAFDRLEASLARGSIDHGGDRQTSLFPAAGSRT